MKEKILINVLLVIAIIAMAVIVYITPPWEVKDDATVCHELYLKSLEK